MTIGHEVRGAVVGAMYWVPLNQIDAHRVRKHFTIEKHGRDFMTKAPTYSETPIYRMGQGDYAGFIGLPLAEGMRLFPCPDYTEDLSYGTPFLRGTHWHTLPDPNHPLAAPGQAEFMRLAEEAVRENYATLVKADTGTGKTVVALSISAKLGYSTVVKVPLDRLAKQWAKAAIQHLGMDKKDIGYIVGDKCQHDRPLVIAMQKSLAVRTYSPEVYRAFGFEITDEVHNTGAPVASQSQGLFNAAHRLNLSATDERRDGSHRVYHANAGQPAFERSMPGMPTAVLCINFTTKKGYGDGNKSVKLINLAYDFPRNRIITNTVARWYEQGHYPLILCDHVRHAHILWKMLIKDGVPENKIGFYTGEQPGDETGTRGKSSPDYLEWCEKHATVVIATYGMMKEGIDMPRLDRGMDASPRADLVQALGRIRRIHPGKDRAIWATIRDRGDRDFDGLYFARVQKLSQLENVTIHHVAADDVPAWR